MTILAGVAFLVGLTFLPALELSSGEVSIWDIETTTPIVLSAVAVLALFMAVASIASTSKLMPVLVAGCGFYLFGKSFALDNYGPGLGVGYWTAASASLAMAVGGVLAAVGQQAPR